MPPKSNPTSPVIDPGEAWAVALGVGPVLSKQIGRVTADQRRTAFELPSRVAKLAAQCVQGKLTAGYPDVPKYKALFNDLSRTMELPQIEAMIARLPDEAKLPYMTVAARQFEFLTTALPRPIRETLAGIVPMPPDPVALHRFAGLYRVVNNPLYLLDLMSSGSVLANQCHAVRIIFPTLSAYFDTVLRDAVVEQVTRDASFQVPYLADSGIRDYLDMEQIYKPYQAAFIPPLEEDAGQKPSLPSSGVAPESKASLSAAQNALYGNVGR